MADERGLSFFRLHQDQPDLLLLDVTLPSRNGLDLLKQIREERLDVRVMLLTSHNSVEDRVYGLRTGADDYLGKPFSFPELLARIFLLVVAFGLRGCEVDGSTSTDHS